MLVGCGGDNGDTANEETTVAQEDTTTVAEAAGEETDAPAGDTEAVADELGEVKANGKYKVGFTMPTRDQFLFRYGDSCHKRSKEPRHRIDNS